MVSVKQHTIEESLYAVLSAWKTFTQYIFSSYYTVQCWVTRLCSVNIQCTVV